MKNIFIFSVLILSFLFSGCHRESNDLRQLKTLLKSQYNPVMVQSQQGNITSFNTVDTNMQAAVDIILTSSAADITPWLKKNIGKYPAAFLFAFANRLSANKEPLRDYWFWRTAAIYRGASDASLCEDKYVGQYLTILIMNFIAPADARYDLEESRAFVKNKKENIAVIEELMDWDKQNPAVNSPAWFCASGHAVTTEGFADPKQWAAKRKEFSKDFFDKTLESFSETAELKRFLRRAISDLDLAVFARNAESVKTGKDIFSLDFDALNFSVKQGKTNSNGKKIKGKEWLGDEYKITLLNDNSGKWIAVEEITVPDICAVIGKNQDGAYCCDDTDKGICALSGIEKSCTAAGLTAPYI